MHKSSNQSKKLEGITKTPQNNKLQQLSKLTGELAHELKNPLSTIKVNLKLIKEELEIATKSQQIEIGKYQQSLNRALRKISVIERESDRLEQTLESFLRYIGNTELQLETIDINELISDMVDFFLPQAHSHSITVRQSLSSQPLKCKVDTGMFKQVLLNMFINAQQALDNGGELMIKTELKNNSALIGISDTGKGISSDNLEKIFEPYYSTRQNGTGLGLATAKKIIEAHKGSISVYSDIGLGAAFTIKLPLASKEQ